MAQERRRRGAATGRPEAGRNAAARPERRRWVIAAGVFLAVAALVVVAGRGGLLTPARPNVLFVTIDTLRADRLGSYGYARAQTPVLDALAARGVRFTTAVAHAPLTGPSHASLLTGLTPLRHGVRDNGRPTLSASAPTVAEAFRGAGWHTAAFVSGFPLDHRFGFDRGFETYDDHLPHGDDSRRAAYVERTADRTTAAALRWLETAPAGAPWFTWVHYFDPHAPYEPPDAFAARAPGRPYDGEVAFVDAQLGVLLHGLEARGERERTVVLVTADHGESLGEHGEETHGVFVYEATLRVPLIVAGPGVPRGRVSSTVGRGVDVAPTLLDLAGAPPLAGAEGRSLRPALSGREMADAPAYVESLFAALNLGWAPLHGWRTARRKLIDAPRPELYALDQDPGETRDLSASSAHDVETLRASLRAALAAAVPARPGSVDHAAAERLAALGYLSGGPGPPTTGRDPKDGIALINQMERGLAEARSNPPLAIAALQGVLQADPHMPLAHRYLAIAHSAAGDPAAALRELGALAGQGPLAPDDLLLQADTLRQAGRAQEALEAADRALSARPGDAWGLVIRGRALLALDRAPEARATYERALEKDPADTEALRGLADAAFRAGNAGAAEGAYARILKADPTDTGALVRLGALRVRAGRVDEAREMFARALERNPRDAEALLDMGGLLARSGQAREAVPYLERAVQAGMRTPVALNSLGFARLEAGDRAGGRQALRESLAVDPRQEDVRAALTRLGAGR